MRRLVTLLLAFGLLVGLAGTALACSNASQANSTLPTTEQARSQT
jgi:hypothetical protein